jgi:hypothetical protein
MNTIEQQFFNDLEKQLWTAADKLRSNLDAAVYKHVMLGLIFLKYVSDAFEERQKELREQFQNPATSAPHPRPLSQRARGLKTVCPFLPGEGWVSASATGAASSCSLTPASLAT